MVWLAATEILLLLQGAYSQLFQAEAAREMAARFGGTELCYVSVMVASMAWVAAGCAVSTLADKVRGRGSDWLAAALCALSPLAALSSYAFAASGPPLIDPGKWGVVFSSGEMFAYCLLAPMLFGLLNGALYGAICGLLGKERGGRAYAADSLGAMLGGLAFSCLLASLLPPMSLLAMGGAILPIFGFAVCGRRLKSPLMKVLCGAHCAACVALAGLLGTADGHVASLKWSRVLPGHSYEGSVETASGRVEFLKDLRSKNGQLAIYRDGELEATLPKDRELEYPTALFAVAQPKRDNLSILLVCSPFSSLPEALASLPAVAKVELVCPEKPLADLAQRFGLLPEDSGKFKVVNQEPRRYMETCKGSYDLIMILGARPSTLGGNRLFTVEFFKSVAAKLKPGGAYICSMESSPGCPGASTMEFNGMIDATLRSVFPKVACTPGSLKIMAAGFGDISASFDELDNRLAKLMPGERSFPEGLLGVVFSQSEQEGESLRVAQNSIGASLNRDLSPELPFLHMRREARIASGDASTPGLALELLEWALFLWKELVAGAIALYAAARYFMSWKMSRKMAFLSFENGFYATGLAIMLLFMHQTRCGALYRDLAAASGIFMGGAALGALAGARTLKFPSLLKWLSLTLPLLVPMLVFLPWEAAFAGVFAGLFIGGCSVGAGYAEFNLKADSEQAPGFLWSAEILGGAVGAAVLTLFLLPAGGFLACALILAAMRLPFAIGK